VGAGLDLVGGAVDAIGQAAGNLGLGLGTDAVNGAMRSESLVSLIPFYGLLANSGPEAYRACK
jgi:hypothetical protein